MVLLSWDGFSSWVRCVSFGQEKLKLQDSRPVQGGG